MSVHKVKIKKRLCSLPYPKTKGNCDISVFSEKWHCRLVFSTWIFHFWQIEGSKEILPNTRLSSRMVSQALLGKRMTHVLLTKPSVFALCLLLGTWSPLWFLHNIPSVAVEIEITVFSLFMFFLPFMSSCFPTYNKGFLLLCSFSICLLAGVFCQQRRTEKKCAVFPRAPRWPDFRHLHKARKNRSYRPVQEIQPGRLASCECVLTLLGGHSTFLIFLSVHGLWGVKLRKQRLEAVTACEGCR